jgi:Na+-driven multidrug efflux pump
VPFATLGGVLTGAMQGRERLLEINLISVVSTALFQILPLTLAWTVGPELPLLLGAALSARLMTVIFVGVRCYTDLAAGHAIRVEAAEIKSLLKFGGWVSITAILSPLLFMVDRFVIGAVLGATAVTEYTVPYQLANRVVILPGSLMTALYPRLLGTGRQEQAALARKATQTLWCLLPVPFLGAIFVIGPFLKGRRGSRPSGWRGGANHTAWHVCARNPTLFSAALYRNERVWAPGRSVCDSGAAGGKLSVAHLGGRARDSGLANPCRHHAIPLVWPLAGVLLDHH